MSNVQVSTHYTHVPDPVSLDGLDDFLSGLIDELFQIEEKGSGIVRADLDLKQIEEEIIKEITRGITEEQEAVSEAPGIFTKTAPNPLLDERPSIFEGDGEVTSVVSLKLRMLESQLDYRNGELKESVRRIQWLENELASREDQLKFLPELLKRSVDATRYEYELDDLKLKLEFLSSELTAANTHLDAIKANWLGRLSMWLAAKRAEQQAASIVEASD